MLQTCLKQMKKIESWRTEIIESLSNVNIYIYIKKNKNGNVRTGKYNNQNTKTLWMDSTAEWRRGKNQWTASTIEIIQSEQ